jgi:hypothetical protein
MMNYQKQVAETGKIETEMQQEPQKNIIDWCSINDNFKLLQGNLYNVGFFPKAINPSELNLDYKNLAKDMDFLQECKTILDEAGCANWRFNDTTGYYYSFICEQSMNTNEEIISALGIIPSMQKAPFIHYDEESAEPKIISVDFFDDEAACIEEELENDEDADIEDSQLHLKAYEKVNDLLRENIEGTINEFAILAGYDYYPIFKIGKSKFSGNYIGFITVVSNRYIYGD